MNCKVLYVWSIERCPCLLKLWSYAYVRQLLKGYSYHGVLGVALLWQCTARLWWKSRPGPSAACGPFSSPFWEKGRRWMDVVLSCQAQWPEPTRKYHNSCLFWSFTLITDGVSFLHYQDVPSKLVSHFYDWGHCALQPALWTCLCWQLKIGLRHPLTSELQTCIDSWVFI